jgi:pentatricopeptide repeat protein
MQSEGLPADAATFVSMLKACGGLGALHKGMQIHDEVSRRPCLEKDMSLQTAVIYMYAKCGMLDRAREVLESLPFRDIVCWAALISGYADQRQGHKAIDCFGRMQSEGVSLDKVTFLCILSACSRSGLHAEAEDVLRDMVSHYGLPPMKEHLTCMIASLGHGGEFEKTISMIELMPCSHHLGIWIALLGMCRRWGNAELGRLAFDRAIQIKHSCGTAYILMADILTSSGSGEDARKIEAA